MYTSVDTKNFQASWEQLGEAKANFEEAPIHYPAPKTQTYYRSKAFVSQAGVNPLVAASAPLFFLVEKIKSLTHVPDIDKLHDDLIHEIKAFEHQAQTHGYRSYMIMATRYALCLWIDETILNIAWGQHCNWQAFKLVDDSDSSHRNPFFLLINRCLQDPDIYIDMLELLYLCLSFGFQGDYRYSEGGQLKLRETQDMLFETICKLRDNVSKQLEINTSTATTTATLTYTQRQSDQRWWLRPFCMMITLFLLLSGYLTLDHHLSAAFKAISMPLSSAPHPEFSL